MDVSRFLAKQQELKMRSLNKTTALVAIAGLLTTPLAMAQGAGHHAEAGAALALAGARVDDDDAALVAGLADAGVHDLFFLLHPLAVAGVVALLFPGSRST